RKYLTGQRSFDAIKGALFTLPISRWGVVFFLSLEELKKTLFTHVGQKCMRKDSTTYVMFEELVQQCGQSWETICSPRKVSIHNWSVAFEHFEPKQRSRAKCRRLQKMGYFIEEGNGLIFTKQAKLFLLRENIEKTSKTLPAGWRVF